MEVFRYPDARAFLDRASGWLLEAEAEHNSILGDAYLLSSQEHPFDEPIYMASVEDRGKILACAVRPPPDGLTLTGAPRKALELLVEDVGSVFDELPGLSGPQREAEEFASLWSSARGCDWSLSFLWRWYALEDVADVGRRPAGRLRLAGDEDRELADLWALAYASAVRTRVDVQAFFERRISTRSLYLWEDGRPRSLVAVSGLTPTTARISAVYTPPDSRGCGYATAAVAEVSSLVLASGRKTCVLFADRTDPTPNSIYRRIGYQPILDSAGITFRSPCYDGPEPRSVRPS